MALFDYLKQTQRFLREAKQDFINPDDLREYVNRARREIAMRAQCIRRLTAVSGQIVTVTMTNGGTGYSNTPTFTVTTPDFPSGQGPYPNGAQAILSPIVQSGVIVACDVQFGGAGYWQPQLTITDPTGTGAVGVLNLSIAINQIKQGQEVYRFSDVDLTTFPGVDSIYMIKSVSVLFANYRYSLPCYSFSTYQAMMRQWAQQFQYVPCVCAQYGQGADGSFYMYPVPSQAYQVEFDALCIPSDLLDDQSVEALPKPWTEAVPYFAAHLAFLEIQNMNSARYFFDLFDRMVQRYSDYARPGRITNPYGRYVLPFTLGVLETLQHLANGFV